MPLDVPPYPEAERRKLKRNFKGSTIDWLKNVDAPQGNLMWTAIKSKHVDNGRREFKLIAG